LNSAIAMPPKFASRENGLSKYASQIDDSRPPPANRRLKVSRLSWIVIGV